MQSVRQIISAVEGGKRAPSRRAGRRARRRGEAVALTLRDGSTREAHEPGERDIDSRGGGCLEYAVSAARQAAGPRDFSVRCA